jgi:hypothetical protein
VTAEDIKKLRAIAEAALADGEPVWTYVGGPLLCDVHVETRPKNPGRSRIRVDANAIGPFIAAASPGTVIALIDEIAHANAAAHAIADKAADFAVECAKLEVALAMMTAARDEAISIFDETWCTEHGHTPRDEQFARIDELRKVGAK